jgi:GAF domain-containing protein
VTVGAIQVVDKRTGTGAFTEQDKELLEGLAAAAATAIRNAQLHGAERRARDLAVLLEISQEITGTLDLDRVLQSVVNLASRALPFDRGAVALYEKGHCDIRAVAGQETVDPKDPRLLDLVARTEWAAGRGEPLYLSDREDPASDAERLFVTIFGQDLENDQVRSGLYLPLKDEEGVLGVLVFEASSPNFAGETQREVAAILANQTGVALRNAQLYHQVPMVDALGALAARKQALLALPRRRLQAYVATALLLLAAVTLIRWPLRVSGADPVLRPNGYTPVRVMVDGTVERVAVREGSRAQRGDVLAVLRATSLAADREGIAADAVTADRLASLAASRGDAAEERMHRIRGEALRRELALLDEELSLTTVRAPAAGLVLTPRMEERTGTSLAEGDQLLVLGRTDTLELEFGVAQHDILRVRQGQKVRLRVDALPSRTFEGSVTSIAELPKEQEGRVEYPVRAAVANPEGLLKPDMAAHARILTDPASIVTRTLRAPVRWVRLMWWRMWS